MTDISKFNKQLIEEVKKINTNKFNDVYFNYKTLIEQETATTDAAPAPTETPAAPPTAPEAAAPATPKPENIPNKPYPEILTIIAKALTVNLYQEPTDSSPENAKSLERLKDFVGEVLEGTKVKQMDKSKALTMLDAVQKTIDNVAGGLKEV